MCSPVVKLNTYSRADINSFFFFYLCHVDFAPEARKAAAEGRGGIIHFEIMPKNINKVVEATEAIEGDATANLTKMLPLIENIERKEWLDTIKQYVI